MVSSFSSFLGGKWSIVQIFFIVGRSKANRQPRGVGGLLAFNNNISEDQLVNIIYLYKAPFCAYVWVLQILMYGARRAQKSYFMHILILDKPVGQFTSRIIWSIIALFLYCFYCKFIQQNLNNFPHIFW